MAQKGHISFPEDFVPMFNTFEELRGWFRRLGICSQSPIQISWRGPRRESLVSLIDALLDFQVARMRAGSMVVDFPRDLCWQLVL